MKDLSLHLLDIAENSAKAGARHLRVRFAWQGSRLLIEMADDGPGLPAVVAVDPTDPYRTTRSERRIGLGLSLLRQSAEQAGGTMQVVSQPGCGVTVRAEFDLSHLDARPLGDLAGVLATLVVAWPELLLSVVVGEADEPILEMEQIVRELDGLPVDHPQVRAFIESCLVEGLAPLARWASTVRPSWPAGGRKSASGRPT